MKTHKKFIVGAILLLALFVPLTFIACCSAPGSSVLIIIQDDDSGKFLSGIRVSQEKPMTFFEKTFNPVGATYFSHSVAAEKSTDQKGEVEFGRFSLEDHYKIYSDNKTNLRITFDGKSFVAKPDMVQVREGFQRYYQGTGQTPSEDDWLTWVDDPELRQSYTIFYKAASGWEISSPYVLRVKECH